MKKVILSLMFMGTFMFANASSILFFNCHAQACGEVAAWEDDGFMLSEAEAEQIYHQAYDECNN